MKATNRSRLGIYLTLTAACVLSAETATAEAQKVPLPRPRPAIQKTGLVAIPAPSAPSPLPQKRPPATTSKNGGLSSFAHANVGFHRTTFESRHDFNRARLATAA